jgi:hypothetical protein
MEGQERRKGVHKAQQHDQRCAERNGGKPATFLFTHLRSPLFQPGSTMPSNTMSEVANMMQPSLSFVAWVISEGLLDLGEKCRHLRSKRAHDRHDRHGNAGRDQGILNRGSAALIAKEPAEKIAHGATIATICLHSVLQIHRFLRNLTRFRSLAAAHPFQVRTIFAAVSTLYPIASSCRDGTSTRSPGDQVETGPRRFAFSNRACNCRPSLKAATLIRPFACSFARMSTRRFSEASVRALASRGS